MRVAIVGSRSIKKIDMDMILRQIPQNCSEIVSGGADGVDCIAKEVAIRLSVPIKEFLPNYKKTGRSAPFQRNEEIANYCDMLIAVWDYCSHGTRDVLARAIRLNKKIKILMMEKENVDEKIRFDSR